MRIAIFGATGKTGIILIQQALDAEYDVVAYARNTKKLSLIHNKLQVVQGELSEITKINKVIKDVDAVVSLLGASTTKINNHSLSDGIKNIITSMEENNVTRIIQVSTSVVKDANDSFDLYFDFMKLMVRLMIPKMYKELQIISRYIKQSDLDWTLVRVPFLTDSAITKNISIGYKGQKIVKKHLSRENLAWFMLRQISDDHYINKTPFVSDKTF